MVKRALLAAQKGDGLKTITGLKTIRLGQKESDVTTKEESNKRPRDDGESQRDDVEQKTKKQKPNAKRKQPEPSEETPSSKTTLFRVKNALVESIYGPEEAANKRRIMEHKSLEKVTSVREAFEVCFFKAERTEADAERNKLQLEQALTHLSELKTSKAKPAEILKAEEQVRQLRTKITTARATHQTPIDVLVNVAKFSMANCSEHEETPAKLPQPPKQETTSGTIVSLQLPVDATKLLQQYSNSIKVETDNFVVGIPPLKYNAASPFTRQMAKQFYDCDSIYSLHWDLQETKLENQKDESREKEEDDEEEDEDDDGALQNTASNEWMLKNLTLEERLINSVSAINHECSNEWSKQEDEKQYLQKAVAEKLADRLVSLFFKNNITELKKGDALDANVSSTAGEKQSDKKEVRVVRIGHLEKSSAIGGKSRNRVRNKMKPARNTENISIMNFLSIKMHEMSDKHVEAAKFIKFLQNYDKQRGDGQQSADTMFSTFINKQNDQNQLDKRGLKRKRDDVGDCSNAFESLPLPNYSSPQCRYCNAPVHVSSRTGMETCTSPSCAASVYMATGFDVVHLEQQIHNTYQYLLAVHMKSTLRRVQGKESAMVPKRVKDAVKNRLVMERVELKTLTPKKVKLVLKKLDLSAWYNHRHKICASITGKKPYQFSAEEEDVILAVFERLIEPYNLYRPKTDENFPYYRYALHKILQLLGYPDEVLRDFPILKARKNHRRKEQIWEKMMIYRGWPYHKS